MSMGSAREDYEQFVRWLHHPDQRATEDIRRFANLVFANFDAIAATSRQHNSRSASLANLARRSLAATTAALPEVPQDNAATAWPWRRLQHLTVGPFRGFRREEPFDLRKRIVLFYGPNGSGKTSLCDALEHALLGTVQEADIKRIEQPQYFANIHARRFTAPRLTATDHDGQEVAVAANSDTYRFCFIEKNRIDAFARLASRPPAARTELISTLFGMEKFNDFANHFNETMDQVLVRIPENQNTLNVRRQGLARDQQTIAGEQATLLRMDQEDAALADRCKLGMTYVELKALIGNAEVPGRLQELNGLLNAVPPKTVGLTRQVLADRYGATDGAAARLSGVVRQLETRSSHPRVTSNEMSRSYVGRARAAKDALDDREALSYGRRALEMLSNKAWKWLAFLDRGTLVVEIERPGGEPIRARVSGVSEQYVAPNRLFTAGRCTDNCTSTSSIRGIGLMIRTSLRRRSIASNPFNSAFGQELGH
jgi:DNA polymerase III delta prime subunit